MTVKYAVTVLFENAQSAHVLAEKISRDYGVVVDVIGRQEIATYHPPVKVDIPPKKKKD